jgi:hypothetical protein
MHIPIEFENKQILKKPDYGTKCAQSEATLICKYMADLLFFFIKI